MLPPAFGFSCMDIKKQGDGLSLLPTEGFSRRHMEGSGGGLSLLCSPLILQIGTGAIYHDKISIQPYVLLAPVLESVFVVLLACSTPNHLNPVVSQTCPLEVLPKSPANTKFISPRRACKRTVSHK